MGVWIILVVILALTMLPLGIRLHYNREGFLLKVIVGPVRMKLYPRKKRDSSDSKRSQKPNTQEQKPQKENAPSPKDKTKDTKAQTEKTAEESGGSLARFLPFVKMGFRFLGDFRRKLRLDYFYLRLVLAGDDPCDLAVNYGRAWAAMGNLMPQLERLFTVKKKDIDVQCDFEADITTVIVHLDVTITLGRLLVLLVRYGVCILIEYLAMRRKGGITNE